jgi:hypothetical protein
MVNVWVIVGDGYCCGVFTEKTQAEAYLGAMYTGGFFGESEITEEEVNDG